MREYSIISRKTGELTHSCQILLHMDDVGSVVPDDIQELLYCRIQYARNMLRKLWERKFLSRKREKIGRTFRYRYSLINRGEEECRRLHEKGY